MSKFYPLLIILSFSFSYCTNNTQKASSDITAAALTICPSCNLSGHDFKGQDLTDANFLGAILDNVDFSNAKLDGATFSNASLKGAKFDGATLKRSTKGPAHFFGANLSNAHFDQTIFEDTELQHALISGTAFSNTDLSSVMFGPKIKFSDKPIFDNVVLSCEFPWLWDQIDIKNSELPDCSNYSSGIVLDENFLSNAPLVETAQYTIYVSGDDGTDSANCGTSGNPCQTISKGISQCPGSDCNALVDYGDYTLSSSIILQAGINLYGGLVGWQPSTYQSTIYAPGGGQPVLTGTGLSDTLNVKGFILNGSNANSSGKASTVINLLSNSILNLEYIAINAAKGSKGANGTNGEPGANGGNGKNATFSNAGAGGAGGFRANNDGGKGGNPAIPTNLNSDNFSYKCNVYTGQDGKKRDSRYNAYGGLPGTCGNNYGWSNPKDGYNGNNGQNSLNCGRGGISSVNTTGSINSNTWGAGPPGGLGKSGGAGSGGGSGGSCVNFQLTGQWTIHIGGAGGGGGAGGAGGGVANGGEMGGASIGILLINSQIMNGSEVYITPNKGGSGGNGGNGANGGNAGSGGNGYTGDHSCSYTSNGSTSSKTAGKGGKGGNGKPGNPSGGGAGGNGGPAIGIAVSGNSSIEGSITYYTGLSGDPGNGGTGLSNSNCTSQGGSAGINGSVSNTYQY